MTYIEQAIEHAKAAHFGQTDLAGEDYINHLETVATLTSKLTNSDTAVAMAWLHDIIEDGLDTEDDLRIQGYPDDIIEGIMQLSNIKNQTYIEYINGITNPDARIVKIADLLHNQDSSRLKNSSKHHVRKHKYHRALNMLCNQEMDKVIELLRFYEDFKKEYT